MCVNVTGTGRFQNACAENVTGKDWLQIVCTFTHSGVWELLGTGDNIIMVIQAKLFRTDRGVGKNMSTWGIEYKGVPSRPYLL